MKLTQDKMGIKLLLLLTLCIVQPVTSRDGICKRRDSIEISKFSKCPPGYGITDGCCYKCKVCDLGSELRDYQENACYQRKPDCVPCKEGFYSNSQSKTGKCLPDRDCGETYQVRVPGTYSKVKPSDCGDCINDKYVLYNNNKEYGCVLAVLAVPTPAKSESTVTDTVTIETLNGIESRTNQVSQHPISDSVLLSENSQGHQIKVIYVLMLVGLAIVVLVLLVLLVFGGKKLRKWLKRRNQTKSSATVNSTTPQASESQASLFSTDNSIREERISFDDDENLDVPNEATPFNRDRPNVVIDAEPLAALTDGRSLRQPGQSGNLESEGGERTIRLPDLALSGVQSLQGIRSQRSSDPARTNNQNEIRVASLDADTDSVVDVEEDVGARPCQTGSGFSLESVFTGTSTVNTPCSTSPHSSVDLLDVEKGTSVNPSNIEAEEYHDEDEGSGRQGYCMTCGDPVGRITSEKFGLCQQCQKQEAKQRRNGRQHSFTSQLEGERNTAGRKYSASDREEPIDYQLNNIVHKPTKQTRDRKREDDTKSISDMTVKKHGLRYLRNLNPSVLERLADHLDNTDGNSRRNRRETFANKMGILSPQAGTYQSASKIWQDLYQQEKTVAHVIQVLWKMELKWVVRDFCEDINKVV